MLHSRTGGVDHRLGPDPRINAVRRVAVLGRLFRLCRQLRHGGWGGLDFGIDLPGAFPSARFSYDIYAHAWASTGAIFNLPPCSSSLRHGVAGRGDQGVGAFNGFIVVVKLVVICLLIALHGVLRHDGELGSLRPIPWRVHFRRTPARAVYGWSGGPPARAVVVSPISALTRLHAAHEAKTPERDMPIGIRATLAICTALYVSVGPLCLPPSAVRPLNVPYPIAVASMPSASVLSPVSSSESVRACTSVILVTLLGQPRIFRANGADGLLRAVVCKSIRVSGTLCRNDRLAALSSPSRRPVADRLVGETRPHRTLFLRSPSLDRHDGARAIVRASPARQAPRSGWWVPRPRQHRCF